MFRRIPVFALVAAVAAGGGVTQGQPGDFAQAERFLASNTTPLVSRANVQATWMSGDRFYYRNTLADSAIETVIVDPVRPGRVVCAGVVTSCEGQQIVEPPQSTAAATPVEPHWAFEFGGDDVDVRAFTKTGEVLRFSMRDGRGHLYLHDLKTGQLKHQVTRGAWNVTEVTHISESARMVYFFGVGREAGRDPYYRHLYRVDLAGTKIELLTPDIGNHVIAWSPSRRYFIDTWSTPQKPPISVLRTASGGRVVNLQDADITALVATGWTPPIDIIVKARDGMTDLYGLMHVPPFMTPGRKYPTVIYIQPGPGGGGVGSRTFLAARGDARALAELGFVVVQVDGLGTPWRSMSFFTAHADDPSDFTVPDQVAAIRQLAERHPFIDLARVGIYGHGAGGAAADAAISRYPDVFIVAVSESGDHDDDLAVVRRRWEYFVTHLRGASVGGTMQAGR